MKKYKPTDAEPFVWGCIEWESLRITTHMVQIHDEYKGVTLEIHVETDGTLSVYNLNERENDHE